MTIKWSLPATSTLDHSALYLLTQMIGYTLINATYIYWLTHVTNHGKYIQGKHGILIQYFNDFLAIAIPFCSRYEAAII